MSKVNISALLRDIKNGNDLEVSGGKLSYYKDSLWLCNIAHSQRIGESKARKLLKEKYFN